MSAPKKSVIVFGCGMGGRRALDHISKDERVIAFSDNDPNKVGSRYLGFDVIAPKTIPACDFAQVLIASQYADAICLQLLELGVPENKIQMLSCDALAGVKPKRHRFKRALLAAALLLLGGILRIRAALARRKANRIHGG